MPPRRRSGLRTLKAVSSSLRIKVLTLLFDEGPKSYTEIMKILRLNPTRDAGRFAYHLKFLLKADLIEPDVKTKDYHITDLGRAVLEFTEEIEKQSSNRKKMLVRTSRLAIEEFERNKIVDSLVNEASVPLELAQKIARETEKRLSAFKAKYLTAPLIREIVNVILVEKGLEGYRHKLTRLGLPVFDVTRMISEIGYNYAAAGYVQNAAGEAVIEEYTLLNVLPRDISDAHLSGTLNISNLGSWILKPNEFLHDLRFFIEQGLILGRIETMAVSCSPPKSLESALFNASSVIKTTATEISGEQAFDYFNVFLAPFIKGIPEDRVREALRLFILNLNQPLSERGLPARVSLGLEFMTPDFLDEIKTVGIEGVKMDRYGDFAEESRLIASILLELMFEDDKHKPISNPSLIVKIRPDVLRSKECESLLFQSHELAAQRGIPYFANLYPDNQKYASYTATGFRLANDWKGDWDLDTIRTGNIANVIINLPRASYEAGGKETRLFEFLEEQIEMAVRALEIKYQAINQRARAHLFSILAQKADGNHYFRLENASRVVSYIGLNEAIESFFGETLHHDSQTLDFAETIVNYMNRKIQKYSRKPETRTSLGMVSNSRAARRLAELDAEKYGWAKVHAQGTKEYPFYTDMVAVPLTANVTLNERLRIEERFHRLAPGGHLALLQLGDSEPNPNEVLSETSKIVGTYSIGLYHFNKNLGYCPKCQKTFHGILERCPECGSVNIIPCFSRVSAKHSSLP